ncbi:hypothetical protein SAMN02910357_02368 [Succinivibrio dextrinosolvens]|uniref:CocE/NonD family hydrolase n=1 Tax=Succinivibrio dextrinosolvens TaxID=83771 RepID=UPI0008E558D7|nr:CocE/NonD family hydrolase [Succinivibrio dextrinosolvens]SFS88029.1 hypothetical protein SAMN02910357_02368 [Succinivibrio dextrinosolvens]
MRFFSPNKYKIAISTLLLQSLVMSSSFAYEPSRMALEQTMPNGESIYVWYRKGLPVNADRARGNQLKTETILLKKGSVRRHGSMTLPCDIALEKDVPVKMRDGTTIYVDIFRPNDSERHPAIMAWSPYGKEIGGQWLDDVPFRAGVPQSATSGLEKFEGPDPAYWVAHGYAIINPDSRGAYNSEGNLNYWGQQNSEDGYDTIEWAAKQSWCNGNIGMSGNSWLTVSQWFIASVQPPHLKAIAPWEGFVDHFRETANRGGIPNPVFPEVIFETFASRNYIEDQPRMVLTYPFINGYWEDKCAKLEDIKVPAYVVASYTNPVHTHGTFAGFNKISSKDKWLRVHNTNEWFDYYTKDNVEDLRKFFDHYLMDKDNGWENTPRVRLSVLDPGHEDIVNRVEKEFPLKRTDYRKLYLSYDNTLKLSQSPQEISLAYDCAEKQPQQVFTYTFEKDTEVTGYMKLHTFVEASGADDMDLHVTVEKLDADGNPLFDRMSHMPIFSEGYFRVSQRALDENRSTDYDPVLKNTSEELLSKGEIVPVDIAIWPMGMIYHKGEKLCLKISPYVAPSRDFVPRFGSAKITLAKNEYTFAPDSKVKFRSIGGNADFVPYPEDAVKVPKSRNHGKHIFHMGGQYQSYLQIPVIRK